MKEIPLTQGKVALVDDEDFEWLMEYKWHCTTSTPRKRYAARKVKFGDKQWRTAYMHRVIMGDKVQEVDHIDGNTLNNTKSNLRSCSHSQNISNQKRSIWNSGFRGVYWKKDKKRWRVTIRKDKKNVNVGAFKCKIEAALAYNVAALRLFGSFAHLNQIPE